MWESTLGLAFVFSLATARYLHLEDPYFSWLFDLVPIAEAVVMVTVAIVFFGVRRTANKRYVNLGLRGSAVGK